MTKVTATIEQETAKARAALRKGALAYIGVYGAAYDIAKTRFTKFRSTSNTLFDQMVEKGTEIETQAVKLTEGLRAKAGETVETGTEKVRNVLPFGSNDRVAELEAEVKALNAKIKKASKKAAPAKRKTVKAKMATEKKVAKPVKKAAATVAKTAETIATTAKTVEAKAAGKAA